MSIPISDYDYVLPKDLIAQEPARPRESARLMIVSRKSRTVEHRYVSDLPEYFKDGDIVIVNNTKVFKARLKGTVTAANGMPSNVEILLIRPEGDIWQAVGQPGRKLTIGRTVTFGPDFSADITAKHPDGSLELAFHLTPEGVIAGSNAVGHVPMPHYIKTEPTLSEYQTSFAKVTGSVAAPTAGFHLTENIRKQLTRKGVTILEITLHVGPGTFVPIKTDTIDGHVMQSEWVYLDRKTAENIRNAKADHRRITAIGTTTVRSLEGIAALNNGIIRPYSGDISLFIKPGFGFSVIDTLLTNFHLPKSTLLVLVSTFAGRELIMNAYQEAIRNQYRFYSFGDAMLIL